MLCAAGVNRTPDRHTITYQGVNGPVVKQVWNKVATGIPCNKHVQTAQHINTQWSLGPGCQLHEAGQGGERPRLQRGLAVDGIVSNELGKHGDREHDGGGYVWVDSVWIRGGGGERGGGEWLCG